MCQGETHCPWSLWCTGSSICRLDPRHGTEMDRWGWKDWKASELAEVYLDSVAPLLAWWNTWWRNVIGFVCFFFLRKRCSRIRLLTSCLAWQLSWAQLGINVSLRVKVPWCQFCWSLNLDSPKASKCSKVYGRSARHLAMICRHQFLSIFTRAMSGLCWVFEGDSFS